LAKEGGLAGLGDGLGNVVKAYVIGREAQEFALDLGDTPHAVCTTMEAAVELAASKSLI
jgi:UDP-N-acetylmuramoylalanine--D-glutamate ligase